MTEPGPQADEDEEVPAPPTDEEVAVPDPSAGQDPRPATAGDGPLLVLTSEELDLLEAAHARHLGLDPDTVSTTTAPGPDGTARAEAMRSLQGRGLLDERGLLTEDSALADLVLLLLDVRLAARALLVVERRLAGAEERPDLRLLHLLETGGVVEDLHHGGWHGLDLCLEADDLAERALAPVLPPDAVAGDGEPVVLDPADPDASAARLRASVLAQLTLASPEAEIEESVLLAVGERGCHLARRGHGPDAEVAAAVLEPVDPDDVRDLVRGWVSQIVEAAEPDGIR
ncbi:hypothetical protein SGUI_3299 [Serinicoccus hydrothermalis]|uniref:Uncharacterized protein n=1 Tax=Serinicoccus hydrothermalis TaxID=1758689 RepID=A0A1B1NGZ8_9MICO|nr:hypothetical protein [Serinicoccus hydrothermalis]ANS80695.1 hypothetical protein SGUI_3299 [Serinicoccus hydrothermalis]